MEELLTKVKQFSGFRISNSHYRIGSKLHISDFYYAKRIFQNSFFANRFAFLLAKAIIKSCDVKVLNDIKAKGLTLVGYGLYSELLLSLVEKFLKKGYGFATTKINHNLVSSEQEMKFIKVPDFLHYTVIVVPIASTFSTSVKIEELVKKDSNTNIIPPHYNLLHVCDKANPEMEKEFGWVNKNINQKLIDVTAYFENSEITKPQRYFISLPTTWKKIEACNDCFPEKKENNKESYLLEEKALFETDNTALVPTIIFDFPNARKIPKKDAERRYILEPEMIKYGHYNTRYGHILYSINTELFLIANIKEVRQWLAELKEDHTFSKRFPSSSHTLLISSCHPANISFINLVNEELFHSAANIIHYDSELDFIQNFELTYGDDINTADRIIFVDNRVKSGRIFSGINDFLHHVLKKRENVTHKHKLVEGIDACIVLVNNSNEFTNEIIQEKLYGIKKIYSFANLHLFNALSVGNKSTLLVEQQRYSRLMDESYRDSLKLYFGKQYLKLANTAEKETEILPVLSAHENRCKKERYLVMLEATHMLYQYFSMYGPSFNTHMDFNEFLTHLHETIQSPLKYTEKHDQGILQLSLSDSCILKALTQYPFTQYAPLKKIVFTWVLQLIDRQVNLVEEQIHKQELNYKSFISLKYLIRRATQMNSNYLFSQKMFKVIKSLFSANGLPLVEEQIKFEAETDSKEGGLFKLSPEEKKEIETSKSKEIKEFRVFFVAQIKELLMLNEVRSLKLEDLIKQNKNQGEAGFRQIIRLLRTENIAQVQKFYELVRLNHKWKSLYLDISTDAPVIESTKGISVFLSQDVITKQSRYRILEQYFKQETQDAPLNNQSLLNYLWIQYFVEFDGQKDYLSLTEKTDYIFKKLSKIFEITDAGESISSPGIFLVIRDSTNKSFLVYDKNKEGVAVLDNSNWYNEEDIFLQKFLNGIKHEVLDYNQTLIELKRDETTKKWTDLYSVTSLKEIANLSYSFLPAMINRLVLMRLSKLEPGKPERKLGMIGIYFKSENENITDGNRIRYLLLLRQSLSIFVERHHQNNEFRDWVISENTKRLALLSGHGKEMLKNLSRDIRFREIALHLEHLQMIILLNKNFSSSSFDDIRRDFDKYYNVRGSAAINKQYLTKLKKMAQDIYVFPEIEATVKCKVQFDPPDIEFAFNERILNLICFELFVNAKKNRWHFLDDEAIGSYTENEMCIDVSITESDGLRKLVMVIKNTGPYIVDTEIMNQLNHRNQNVKRDDITAGTSLLKTLIYKVINGEITFHQEIKCDKNNLSLFCVTLYLNEMK